MQQLPAKHKAGFVFRGKAMNSEPFREKTDEIEKDEGLENLVSFYDLLLKIDMRINPDNYKRKQSHD